MMQRLNAQNAISLLAAAVALTACGGGDTGSTSTPTPAPSVQVAASTCATPPQLFTDQVWPSMSSTCVVCHRAGAVASGTRLVFAVGASAAENYSMLRTFAAANGDLLMSKSVGLPTHSGGKPFVDANSQQYKDLAALLPQLKQSCDTEVLVTGQFWKDVKFADDATTLAKASVLFAGRNPTAAEASAVASGGAPVLAQTIKSYMTGPTFERFLNEVGDTQFLPQGVVVFGNDRGLDPADWPMAADLINNQNLPNGVRARAETTLRREPINLMKFIVNNDRPWTDMVAGNYTVLNGVTAPFLGAQVQGTFVNAADDTEFLPAVLPEARLGGNREHAGAITTHAFLDRFPTTDTNRNRHRASETAERFLALYIPALASRPLEDGQFRVTVMDNPGCAVCHDIMDPMTAGFQNWAPNNRFRPELTGTTNHVLSDAYLNNNYPRDAKGNRFYQTGDAWYRDAKAPGYNGTAMPSGYNNPTAAQWLGQQMAADPRFAMGALHFWWKGLSGREALRASTDTTSADAASRLAAYNAQHDEFKELATRFAANGYKVKDLLVDLMLSKAARAKTVDGAMSAQRQAELHDVGSVTMLSPALLNQKLVGLVGAGYVGFNNPYTGVALTYGDFDGGLARNNRAINYTSNQISVIDGMISRQAVPWTQADFARTPATRLLFPMVTLADTPATPAGSERILANIKHMHKHLWKDDVPTTDAEVQRTYNLLVAIWNDRATPSARPLTSAYNQNNDPTYMGRTWAQVLGYMVGDAKFLYE